MEFLNNRYEIIDQKCETRLCSTYRAIDLSNNRNVLLNVLNNECIPKDFINFLIENCSSLGALNKEGLIPIYDLGIVYKIDNKDISKKTYYYTKELIEDKIKFRDLKLKSLDETLNFFMRLCQMINYLDRQGYEYNYLNDTNIYYNKDKNNILLKDIISIELSKYEFNDENEKKYLFQENNNLEMDIMKSQIYSLGVILIVLCVNDDIKLNSNKLKLFIENIQYDNKEIVLSNSIINEDLYLILRKMLTLEKKYRYDNVTELIKDINKTFNLKFKPYEKKLLEKLNFNTKLVGRKEEVQSILQIYDSLNKYDILGELVAVHGEIGIGKTRFLKYIEYMLKLKNAAVYSTSELNEKPDTIFFTYFLRKVLDNASPAIIKNYKKEICYFIPELEEKLLGYKNTIIDDDDKFKNLTRIIKFIDEVYKDKPIVIIADDLHFIDDYTLNLLEYNFSRTKVNNKILFIFSYCDGEYLQNKKFTNFLASIKENIKLDIRLKELNFQDTGKMVRNILSKHDMPLKFTENIYDYSKGNPLFVEEMLKDIFFRKYIYIHDENGLWHERIDIDTLKLPRNMQDIVQNQTGELDDESIKILSMMSIFNNATSLYLINKLTHIDMTSLCEKINELATKGIICKKIEDRGFVFDFYNKFLKAYLYDNLDKKIKKEKHKLAFNILEDFYLQGNKQYLEEIIYHLVKANYKEKLIYYCTENAKNMLKLNNRKDAIVCFEKMLENYGDDQTDEAYLNIMLNIASLYKEENLNVALDYFEKIIKLSNENNLISIKIEALLNLILIKIEIGNIDYGKIEETKVILSKTNYVEQKKRFETIQCSVYLMEKKYDECIKICNDNIEKCEDNLLIYKFRFANMLINALLFKKEIDKSIEIAKKYFELCPNKFYKQKIQLLNWIGLINSDFYEDMDEALICFKKVWKISKENNLNYLNILGMINIAFIKYSLDEYEEAYKLFVKALERCKVSGYCDLEFYCNIYISNILEKQGKVSETYKYFLEIKKYINEHKISERDVNEFYLLAIKINFIFGKFDEVKKYLYKLENNYEKLNLLQSKEYSVFNILFKGYVEDEINTKSWEKLEEILNEQKNKTSVIQLICNFAIRFYLKKNLTTCEKLIYIVDNSKYDYSKCTKNCTIQINLLKNKFYTNELEVFYNLAKDIREEENNYLLWICFLFIGDYFFEKNQLIYSATYYFEACYIIIDLMVQIHKKLRVNFINKNNMTTVFSKFKCIYTHYANRTEVLDITSCDIFIHNNKDLENVFLFIIDNNFFKNSFLKKYLKNINSEFLKIKPKEGKELLNSLSCDSLKDLKNFLQGIVYKTVSSRAEIIIENNDIFEVVQSSNDDKSLPKDLTIINKARDLKHSIILKENYKEYLNFSLYKKHSSKIKGSICVPIIMNCDCESNFIKRACNTSYSDNIKGYIYIESYRYLNCIGEETLNICLDFSKMFGLLIHKYKTEISSTIDKLTGTLTRRCLDESISNCLECSKEHNLTFSILMFDIDSFKSINDDFGHRKGDFVLREICKVAKKSIRDTDVFCRYGGEEFIIILPETNIQQAYIISERIRTNISKTDILQGKRQVTISIGIANFPEHTLKYEDFIEKADQALYKAKKTGKNKSIIWNENCKKNLNSNNKALSIISGNLNADSNNISTIIEIIDIVGQNEDREDVINKFLEKIISTIDADSASILIVENDQVVKEYNRKILNSEVYNNICCDKKLIANTIKSKKNTLTIDLCNKGLGYNSLLHNWNSVIICPIISKNNIKAILYLSVYIKRKEFTLDDLNFSSVLGDILIPRL